MIKRIKTEDGDRWAVVFGERDTLESVAAAQRGVVNVLAVGTQADIFNGAEVDYFNVLWLLEAMCLEAQQACDIEKLCKAKVLKM